MALWRSRRAWTDGVGFGGIAGDGGLGRIRVGTGSVASAVKDIVRQIEAGFRHTHVGSEANVAEILHS